MKKLLALCFLLFSMQLLFAQNDLDSNSSTVLKIFLKCDACDIQYMKQELPYLNYVRDRKLAQVQIIVTEQTTGAGGSQYALQFLGLQEFDGMQDTLIFSMLPNCSANDCRERMNQYTLLGLTRFIAKTPHAEKWMVEFTGETTNQEIKDKWDYWVFSIGANGWFNGEAYYRTSNLWGYVSARRITNKNKIEFSFNNNYNKNNFYIDDTTEVVSLFSSYYAEGSYIHSLTDHWSAGIDADFSSSIFNNFKANLGSGAMLEYNIFPYSESTRKQFRFYYKVGPRYHNYIDTTILGNTEKLWAYQDVGMYIELTKDWGDLSTWVSYSNFLNNFKFWRAQIEFDASFNLFKGFSLNINLNASLIQNQVSLRAEEASEDEILLRQVQLPTSFQYWGSIGFSYTFGSIYNNIVNPRLD